MPSSTLAYTLKWTFSHPHWEIDTTTRWDYGETILMYRSCQDVCKAWVYQRSRCSNKCCWSPCCAASSFDKVHDLSNARTQFSIEYLCSSSKCEFSSRNISFREYLSIIVSLIWMVECIFEPHGSDRYAMKSDIPRTQHPNTTYILAQTWPLTFPTPSRDEKEMYRQVERLQNDSLDADKSQEREKSHDDTQTQDLDLHFSKWQLSQNQ